MTECKKCGGTGEITVPVEEHLGTVLYGKEQCDVCDGTGEYEPFDLDVELDKLYPPEQTNEEWLRTATTEQLAEWIYQERWTHSDGWYELCGHTVKEVVEWLKQPHTTE